tara:strand:- start:131 stop:376 length:246 start_codon:yes stop_codon:yes gene_type:complete
MINPKEKKLIKDYLSYLEKDGSMDGYILMNKGNWSNNSLFFREAPVKGDKTVVKVRFEMYRPTDEEVDDTIENFLRKRNDS